MNVEINFRNSDPPIFVKLKMRILEFISSACSFLSLMLSYLKARVLQCWCVCVVLRPYWSNRSFHGFVFMGLVSTVSKCSFRSGYIRIFRAIMWISVHMSLWRHFVSCCGWAYCFNMFYCRWMWQHNNPTAECANSLCQWSNLALLKKKPKSVCNLLSLNQSMRHCNKVTVKMRHQYW